MLQQIAQHPPHQTTPLRVLIDLTSLEKCGKFLQMSTPTDDPEAPDPWVRIRWRQAGAAFGGVVFGEERVASTLELSDLATAWAIRERVQLACKLLATVPFELSQGRVVIVQADTEFGTVEFLKRVRKRCWRAVVGMRCNRQMQDDRTLKQLYRNGKRGQQVFLEGMSEPLTVSWFWLKRSQGKRELRFVVSTHPYEARLSSATGTQALLH
ncbi:MAG: hypothetical protein N4J56_004360 [Chroococcidiopsis sp. SAG 2025]|uniref:hypothetical protein n=1 Tax=Chroococcidiopsis sp. SAG 2025 TaxID=171389 RepID=UPI002936D7ED|nr:hypothetical protein [Chroococcidiopsis sp. SAG 2025]MDV2994706.1 hypothetical protein [Chroococcidiopsis sp. SAG 2025]